MSFYQNKTTAIFLFLALFICSLSAHAQDTSDWGAAPISDSLLTRMKQGGSYPEGCTIKPEELRYLKVLYIDFNGQAQHGELVCNRTIATELLNIFRELYRQRYPIASIRLIDDFGADDESSMRANNTSCFCYRTVKGSTKLSAHSRGMAIDINPLQNPCVRYTKEGKLRDIQPDTTEARNYIKRSTGKAHMITASDPCYKLFRKYGFTWGGAWRSVKDYQHFEK